MTQTLTAADNWDDVVLPVNGEARTIDSLIPGFQALLDRTYRLREGGYALTIDGGEFTPTTAIVISGVGEKFTIGDDTDATEMHVAPNALVTFEPNSDLIMNGDIQLSGSVAVTVPISAATNNGRLTQRYVEIDNSGTPKTIGVDSAAGADWTGSIFVMPTGLLGGGVNYTLSTLGANAGDTAEFTNLDATNTVTLNGTTLVNAAGSIRSMVLVYDGSAWVQTQHHYVDS